MFLRELYEAPQRKVAIAAFGRMNPPTIGHEKLANMIKSFDGDHYIFLSQTQKPKDNPLPFDVKLEFAKKFFPGINVGHPSVRTPIQMLQMLEKLGYTDIIYVAGSDRIASFDKLFNDYNGKEYNFNSIDVVSAGERDPDADGAEGMSASKMRAAAASGDYEAFAQGVPKPALAQKMYDAVRTGMGVKDKETTEDASPDEMDKAVLLHLQGIDTSSSLWKKSKRGSVKSDDIENMQFVLKHLGYNPGKIDGWFGRKTAKAVMQFQKDNGLKVDGDPGKNTVNKMIDIVSTKVFGKDNDISATYLDKDGKDTGIPATLGKSGGADFELDKIKHVAQKAIDSAESINEQQLLNEGFPLIVLGTALRMGAKYVAKLLTSQGTKNVAKAIAKNTGKAAMYTGKTIVKNPFKSAMLYGAYEVHKTVKEALEWLKSLNLDGDILELLPLLGKLMVQYKIPTTAILAAIQGGTALYQIAKKEGNPTDMELLAAIEGEPFDKDKDEIQVSSIQEKDDEEDSDPTKGFDAATMKALANLRAMYPNAKSEIAALLKAVSNNKNTIISTDIENDLEAADLADRLDKLEKAVKALKKGKREAIEEILGFAIKNQKKTTIKKKRPPEEDSVKDKLAKRRAMAAKGDPKAYKSGGLDEGSPITDLKKIITSKVYKQEYLLALKMMKDEAISAADAARRFMHVDARTLDKMAEKLGV